MSEVVFSDTYSPLFDLLITWEEVERLSSLDDLTKEEREDFDYFSNLKKVDTVLISGGRDCFTGNQKVITKKGDVNIKDIKKGDSVLTYNERTKTKEFNKVFKTKKVQKEQTIKIKLKNGSYIECTPDHEFFHNGGWVQIKDLLSLWYGDMEENT